MIANGYALFHKYEYLLSLGSIYKYFHSSQDAPLSHSTFLSVNRDKGHVESNRYPIHRNETDIRPHDVTIGTSGARNLILKPYQRDLELAVLERRQLQN